MEVAFVILTSVVSAILTAVLGYLVRTRSKAAEYKHKQKKLAKSYFLHLTDMVAGDQAVRAYIKPYLKNLPAPGTEYDATHQICVLVADLIAKGDKDELAAVAVNFEPILGATVETMTKFALTPAQVSDLPDETIFFYNRYASMTRRLTMGIDVLVGILKRKDFDQITPAILNSIIQNYIAANEAAGILRAAFKKAASISDTESLASLERSFKAQNRDLLETLHQDTKLEAAKKAARASVHSTEGSQ